MKNWIYKGKAVAYEFYKLDSLHQSRVKTYGDKDKVLEEWLCLDSSENEALRIVRNLSDVFGKIGGLQHLIVLVFSFFFRPYTHISFQIEAFNEFFKVKSEDQNLVKKDKAKIGFCEKMKLILHVGANIKTKRLMLKGERRLLKELDMCRIIKDVEKL